MKKIYFLSIPILFLIFSIGLVSDDTDPLDILVQKLREYYARFPQEKTYIQTDRPFYLTGEKIWFKIYLVNATGHQTDSMSKKIFLELVDEEDSVVNKVLLNAADGNPHGFISLPDSIPEGTYTLRAFTTWMLNFDPQYIYAKKIYVGSGTNDLDIFLDFNMDEHGLRPVDMMISLNDLDRHPIAHENISWQLIRAGQVLKQGTVLTNEKGKAKVGLPDFSQNIWDNAHVMLRCRSLTKYFYPPVTSDSLDVQFLPEGGNIINGVESVVAFRATDKSGFPVAIEGSVINEKNNILTAFKSFHQGMGKFSFIPAHGRAYTAIIKIRNGKELVYPLPTAENYAYQLSVVEQDEKKIRVRVSLGDSLYKKGKTTYLVGSSHGKPCFTSKGWDMYEVDIPKASFPEGIAKLTLFNDQQVPVSERLVFVQHQPPKIRFEFDKDHYQAREAVNLSIRAIDQEGQPLRGDFSLAITDDGQIGTSKHGENMRTELLLSSDLSGHIVEPGYYFDEKESNAEEALDLVMLTHGWSRYTWTNIVGDHFPAVQYTQDSSLSIRGLVLMSNGQPAAGYIATLFGDQWGNDFTSSSWGRGFAIDTIDSKGFFEFRDVHFTDSTQFFVQVTNKRGAERNVRINLAEPKWPGLETISSKKGSQDLLWAENSERYKIKYREDIIAAGKGIMMQTIFFKSARKKPNYDERRRLSNFSNIITSEQIEKFGNPDITNALLLAPGVSLRSGKVTIYGGLSMVKGAATIEEPLLVVNGIPMNVDTLILPGSGGSPLANMLNNIPYNTIDFIEILKGADAAIYGSRGGMGVILVNTKKGGEDYGNSSYVQRGTKIFYLPGYHVSKDFYMPRYDLPEVRNNPSPDQRATIYWKPDVKTDANGRANIFFYTSDPVTHYTITLEGISSKGEIIHQSAGFSRP